MVRIPPEKLFRRPSHVWRLCFNRIEFLNTYAGQISESLDRLAPSCSSRSSAGYSVPWFTKADQR